MAQLASNGYRVVRALPQEDRYDSEMFYWLLFVRVQCKFIVTYVHSMISV